MNKPETYAEAPQEIRDGVEQLIRTYGSDPALLAGALVAATVRIIIAAKAEEREAIADLAAGFSPGYDFVALAAAIRNRGEAAKLKASKGKPVPS